MLAWLLTTPSLALPVCAEGVVGECAPTIQAAIDAQLDPAIVELARGPYEEAVDIGDRHVEIYALEGVGDDDYPAPLLRGAGGLPPLRVDGGTLRLDGLMLASPDARAIEAANATVFVVDSILVGTEIPQLRGALIRATESRVEVRDSTITGGHALLDGGQIHAEGGRVVVHGSTLRGGTAEGSGGLIWATTFIIEDSELEGGRATGAAALHGLEQSFITGSMFTGGEGTHLVAMGVLSEDVGVRANLTVVGTSIRGVTTTGAALVGRWDVTVEDVVFDQVVAAWLVEAVDASLERSTVCDSRVDGALVTATEVGLSNNVVLRTAADGLVRSRVGRGTPLLVARHNTVADVDLREAPFRIDDVDTLSSVENNLFVDARFTSRPETGEMASARYELWWPGGPPDWLALTSPVSGDPMFTIPDGCPTVASAVPAGSWYGATVDTGAPDQYDPDASRVDIGAVGGLGMAGFPFWDDTDDDGVPAVYDCDDVDATVVPGGEDVPYDGWDQDCAADDDFDADGDGHASAEWRGTDCDDTDPERHPDRPEVLGNRIDDDCDGLIDEGATLQVSRRCEAVPSGGALLGAWLVLLVARRRRP